MNIQAMGLGKLLRFGRIKSVDASLPNEIIWIKVSNENDFMCYNNKPNMCFDAPEPGANSREHRSSGCNYYFCSNVDQWLNSASQDGSWFRPAHPADELSWMMYAHGFLGLFHSDEISAMVPRKITVKVPPGSIRTHGTLVTKDRLVSLPSVSELVANSACPGYFPEEGKVFDYFAEGVRYFTVTTRSATNCANVMSCVTGIRHARSVKPDRVSQLNPVIRLSGETDVEEISDDRNHRGVFQICPPNPFADMNKTEFLSLLNVI